MAILIDFNQVVIASIMVAFGHKKHANINEDMIRHLALNSLRYYRTRFKDKYGELVICCDDKRSWRKDIFPYYKAHRKKDRDESDMDWKLIFDIIDKMKQELVEYFPYKVIHITKAEADDIIGLLCRIADEDTVIVSSDKDFRQLQTNKYITQWSPRTKRFIRDKDPMTYLKEHIIRGDRTDGIPNFLSKDDTFVNGSRQRRITEKRLTGWMDCEVEGFDENKLRGFKRNEQLINLLFTPAEIQKEIIDTYNEKHDAKRNKIFGYFIKHRMKMLMNDLQDF